MRIIPLFDGHSMLYYQTGFQTLLFRLTKPGLTIVNGMLYTKYCFNEMPSDILALANPKSAVGNIKWQFANYIQLTVKFAVCSICNLVATAD